jgi:hypothetical protein
VQIREVPWPLDPGEGARQLVLRRGENPFSSLIGKSGLVRCKDRMHVKSRSAIPRFDRDRQFLEGQVARIQSIGIPAFGVSDRQGLWSRGPANRETPKLTWQRGPEYSVEYRWREAGRSAFRYSGF